MRILEIVPARRWVHVSGRTASVCGSCPWLSEVDRPDWTLDTYGFTWRVSDGTVGLGRPAAKTLAEALQVMERVNSLGVASRAG